MVTVSMTPPHCLPLSREAGPRLAVAVLVALAATAGAALAPGWSGVGTVAWLAIAGMAWRAPALAIALLAVTVPLQERHDVPTIVGDATITGFVAWALIAGVAGSSVRRRIVFDRATVGFLVAVTVLIASYAAGGVGWSTWYEEVYHWLLPAVVYIACRSVPIGQRGAPRVLAGVAVGVGVVAWEAVRQAITGHGPASFEVDGLLRVYGTFSHPNTLASYLVIAIPPLIAVSMHRRSRPADLCHWACRAGAVAGVITLVLTQSRGGWLAFAAAMLVVVLLSTRHVQRTVALVGIAAVVIVVASGRAGALPGIERFASISTVESTQVQVTTATWGQMEREAHWGAAISMLREHPLFGVGAGAFNDNYRAHTPVWRYRVGRGHAHDGYLHFGAQAGIPGMAAFTLWIGTILGALARGLADHARTQRAVVVGVLGSASAFAVHSIVEYIEVRSLLVLLALLVAVALNVDDGGRSGGSPPIRERRPGSVS